MSFVGVLMLDTHALPWQPFAQAAHDVVSAAQSLVAAHPQLTTLVLECTNMPPYADAVAAATGRRVEHIMTLIEHHWSPMP